MHFKGYSTNKKRLDSDIQENNNNDIVWPILSFIFFMVWRKHVSLLVCFNVDYVTIRNKTRIIHIVGKIYLGWMVLFNIDI